MMPCPWIMEMAEAFQATPDLDLGVHVTFTSEWPAYKWGPVSSKDRVSSLLDPHGYFPARNQAVQENANAAEFEIEMRAQIELALALGFRPTHLDSHMDSCFVRRDLFEIFVNLGKEYGLIHRLLRPGDPAYAWMIEERPLPYEDADCRRLEGEGVIFIDNLVNFAVSAMCPKGTPPSHGQYCGAIGKCVPGLNYLFLHTAHNDDEALAILGETRRGIRYSEHLLCVGQAAKTAAEEAGVRLVSWRELSARRGS
jgi:hypothetical protein